MARHTGSSINMQKGILNKVIAAVFLLLVCTSCGRKCEEVSTNSALPIYPDYMDVTVPVNIAPLNFHYTSDGIRKVRTVVSYKDAVHTFDGKEVVWDLQQWKQLLASAQGDSISFSSEIRLKEARSKPWSGKSMFPRIR